MKDTTIILVKDLEKIRGVSPLVGEILTKAEDEYYNDFLSPLATPKMQLIMDLIRVKNTAKAPKDADAVEEIIKKVKFGAYDD